MKSFSYHFYPVGQGLFSAGAIHGDSDDAPRLVWVYDCGTSSPYHLIQDGIEQCEKCVGNRRIIDLLTLSHFDRDHINGVCELIGKFQIGTLMLPYMPLAQRLIVALSENIHTRDNPLIDFFLNPAAYILERTGHGINNILFVPASDSEGPPLFTGQPSNESRSDILEIAYPDNPPDDREEIDPPIDATSIRPQTHITVLRKGSPITWRSLWEFVPYNDDIKTPIPVDFLSRVQEQRKRLLDVSGSEIRNDALVRITEAYDKHFGNSSEARNEISLWLYSGPIWPAQWQSTSFFMRRSKSKNLNHLHPCSPPVSSACVFPNHGKFSIIYSGDGYLDTEARLKRFIEYLQHGRIHRTAVFQVMHHGAKRNWHNGVAAAIAPLISVFSSDRDRKRWGHPSPAVLRDFWPFGAVQVDKYHGIHIVGCDDIEKHDGDA